jgi:hypothetical protein
MKTASAVRKPKPQAKTPAPVAMIEAPPPRERRLQKAGTRGKVLAALSPEFSDFADCDCRLWAIVGLIDLFKSRGFDEPWLERFVLDLLVNVAGDGVDAVEDNPTRVLNDLREAIDELESRLKEARELTDLHEEYEEVRS